MNKKHSVNIQKRTCKYVIHQLESKEVSMAQKMYSQSCQDMHLGCLLGLLLANKELGFVLPKNTKKLVINEVLFALIIKVRQ